MSTTIAKGNDRNGTKPSDVKISDVEDQLLRLRDDIAGLSKTVSAYGTGTAEKAGSELAKNAEQTLDSMRTELTHIEKNLKLKVRENPIQALGVAAGIGFVVALLTRH